MAQKYKNIPVKPETYVRLQLLAEANDRGLGDQVKTMVDRELPECDHKKVPVSVEAFPSIKSVITPAYYCPTCKRVYVHISSPEELVVTR